jgi:hypothetical protein
LRRMRLYFTGMLGGPFGGRKLSKKKERTTSLLFHLNPIDF